MSAYSKAKPQPMLASGGLMQHSIYLFLVLSSLLSLASCASRGFDRGDIMQDVSPQERVITSEDIEEALLMEPQLTLQFRLGVYFEPYSKYSKNGYRAWKSRTFIGDDRDKVLASLDVLKAKEMLSDIFIVPNSIVSAHTPEAGRGQDRI